LFFLFLIISEKEQEVKTVSEIFVKKMYNPVEKNPRCQGRKKVEETREKQLTEWLQTC